MNEMTVKPKRIDWIDIAKGFTILLVIIGHGSVWGWLRGVIFSFHMPLFFIVSCVSFRFSENADMFVKKAEKAFVHLMIPAFGIYFFRVIIKCIQDFSLLSTFDLHALKGYLAEIVSVFIAGSGVSTNVGGATIPALGIPWFLMALFFGRTLYDYLHLKLSGKAFVIFTCLLSVIGFCLGLVQWLPFSFDIVLVIQPLFLFGQWLKEFDMKAKATKTCLISLIVWAGSFVALYLLTDEYMELACRRYPAFPLCFLCAIAGTMFVCSFSQIFSHLEKISIPLKYLGKNSIYMLWIHCFDEHLAFAYNITSSGTVNTVLRVMVDLIVFAIVMTVIEKVKRIKEKRKNG